MRVRERASLSEIKGGKDAKEERDRERESERESEREREREREREMHEYMYTRESERVRGWEGG